MELSHRDQTQSTAARGILPANTHHPLTFHCRTTLYHFTTLEEEISSQCSGITVAGVRKVILNRKTIIAYIPACLLHCLLTMVSSFVFSCEAADLRPVHWRGRVYPHCALTWCSLSHTGAMHPEPSQCIKPWMLSSIVLLDCSCRLFLVLRVCRTQAGWRKGSQGQTVLKSFLKKQRKRSITWQRHWSFVLPFFWMVN